MSLKSFLAASAIFAVAAALPAQDAKKEIKVERVEMNVQQQYTPQLTAINVVDKRWKPKVWLELAVDFKASIARALGGREGTFPSITIKYYAALAGIKTKDGKQVVISGTINYKDVPNDDVHCLGYVAPATLKRLLLKDNISKADVSVSGCEILAGSDVIGGKSSTGAKWWEATDKISFEEAILPKAKTPFAPFWGDYDLATQ